MKKRDVTAAYGLLREVPVARLEGGDRTALLMALRVLKAAAEEVAAWRSDALARLLPDDDGGASMRRAQEFELALKAGQATDIPAREYADYVARLTEAGRAADESLADELDREVEAPRRLSAKGFSALLEAGGFKAGDALLLSELLEGKEE